MHVGSRSFWLLSDDSKMANLSLEDLMLITIGAGQCNDGNSANRI